MLINDSNVGVNGLATKFTALSYLVWSINPAFPLGDRPFLFRVKQPSRWQNARARVRATLWQYRKAWLTPASLARPRVIISRLIPPPRWWAYATLSTLPPLLLHRHSNTLQHAYTYSRSIESVVAANADSLGNYYTGWSRNGNNFYRHVFLFFGNIINGFFSMLCAKKQRPLKWTLFQTLQSTVLLSYLF